MVKDIKKSVTLSCILFLHSGAPDQEITFTDEIKKERVRLYGYRCTQFPCQFICFFNWSGYFECRTFKN